MPVSSFLFSLKGICSKGAAVNQMLVAMEVLSLLMILLIITTGEFHVIMNCNVAAEAIIYFYDVSS